MDTDYIFMDSVKGEFFTLLWYRLKREGIHFAFPQRTLTFRENSQEFSAPSQRELLDSIDLFGPLTDPERDQVQQEAKVRRFGRNEKVIEEGEEGHTFYVVMEGEVSVRSKGKEVTRLQRGGYFGEMSLLTGEPRAATVVALDDAVMLELDRPTFRRLFADHPGLARQLSAILAERRSELRAIAANAPSVEQTPEEHDIFSRLRNMFGLRD